MQQQGIGSYFMEAIFADIESLKLYAGVHVTCFEKYQRLLSKRFPFAIYYDVQGKEITYLRSSGLQEKSGMD
jgi:hypothetical protein